MPQAFDTAFVVLGDSTDDPKDQVRVDVRVFNGLWLIDLPNREGGDRLVFIGTLHRLGHALDGKDLARRIAERVVVAREEAAALRDQARLVEERLVNDLRDIFGDEENEEDGTWEKKTLLNPTSGAFAKLGYRL